MEEGGAGRDTADGDASRLGVEVRRLEGRLGESSGLTSGDRRGLGSGRGSGSGFNTEKNITSEEQKVCLTGL